MIDKRLIFAIGLLLILILPIFLANAENIAKSDECPTMHQFDPYKAYYPPNYYEIRAVQRNETEQKMKNPVMVTTRNGTQINSNLLTKESQATMFGHESMLLDDFENHEAWGTYLDYVEWEHDPSSRYIMGLELINYLQLDLELGNGHAELFAPSSRSPDPNALEVSTVYNRAGTDEPMDYAVGIYDHTVPSWIWWNSSTWMNNHHYLGTLYGMTYYELVLFPDVVHNDDAFAAFFYNFNTQQFDWIITANDVREVDGSGQVYYEYITWSEDKTPLIPSDIPWIEASNIEIFYFDTSSEQYQWSLNYDSLGLSSANAWSEQWLIDQSVPHGYYSSQYNFDWYVGT